MENMKCREKKREKEKEDERDHHIAFLTIERLPFLRMTRTANGYFPLLSTEDDSLGSRMVFDSMAERRGASNFSLGKR